MVQTTLATCISCKMRASESLVATCVGLEIGWCKEAWQDHKNVEFEMESVLPIQTVGPLDSRCIKWKRRGPMRRRFPEVVFKLRWSFDDVLPAALLQRFVRRRLCPQRARRTVCRPKSKKIVVFRIGFRNVGARLGPRHV